MRAAGVEPVVDLPGVGRGLYDQPGAVIPAIPVPTALPPDAPLTQVIARLAGDSYLCLFAGPEPGGGEPLSTVMVGDLAPRSRGTITLGRTGGSMPLVDLRFYSAPGDLERMRATYRHAWSIAQHAAYRGTVERFLMADDAIVADDERLDGLLRATTFSRLTLLGGAAMGSVVDQHCRVLGVEGLRVVDLSIVPVPLRATTALDAMMIGEHAASWIASDD